MGALELGAYLRRVRICAPNAIFGPSLSEMWILLFYELCTRNWTAFGAPALNE